MENTLEGANAFILNKDDQDGHIWSESTDEIADALVAYAAPFAAEVERLESENTRLNSELSRMAGEKWVSDEQINENVNQIEHINKIHGFDDFFPDDYAAGARWMRSQIFLEKPMPKSEWVSVEDGDKPTCEVFATNGREYLVGFLGRYKEGGLYCESNETLISNITHYQIPSPPQIFPEPKREGK